MVMVGKRSPAPMGTGGQELCWKGSTSSKATLQTNRRARRQTSSLADYVKMSQMGFFNTQPWSFSKYLSNCHIFLSSLLECGDTLSTCLPSVPLDSAVADVQTHLCNHEPAETKLQMAAETKHPSKHIFDNRGLEIYSWALFYLPSSKAIFSQVPSLWAQQAYHHPYK